jgi:hypothetical protein
MEGTIVSIAEGKKGFSRLIHNAVEKKEEVIVPYEEYRHSKRVEGYRKIMKARAPF